MKATDIPVRFSEPFAKNATGSYKRTIPVTTSDPVAASLDLGFPPDTFVPPGAGGTPPDGRDLNGIFFASTAWNRWMSAGGPVAYDAAFSTAIGGYPKGAVVASATTFGTFWLCTADDNATDPDAGGANWVKWGVGGSQVFLASGTFTVPAWVSQLKRVRGVGGGGGASTGDGGTGGSAGPFELLNYPVTPGATIAVTVGAVGTSNVYPAAGTDGGSSIFGPATSPGGGGGGGGPGSASTATGGTINGRGQNGVDLNASVVNGNGGAGLIDGFGAGADNNGTNATPGIVIIEW